MKIITFTVYGIGDIQVAENLDKKVNEWLRNNTVEIISTAMTTANQTKVLYTIVYRKLKSILD